MDWPPKHPLLLVVSAPSGAGKTTLCDRLRACFPQLRYSVSVTTRAPRSGEVDGTHYHFVDEQTFVREIEADGFLEHARVHDHLYGTRLQAVRDVFAEGNDVLMDVDVQGAEQIRTVFAKALLESARLVDVFISPPALDELERRLRTRGQDDEAVIRRRLENAAEEMAARDAYTYGVVNDDLEQAFAALQAIVTAEHCRIK